MKKNKSILVIVIGFLILHLIFKINSLFYISLTIGVLSLLSSKFDTFLLYIWEKIALVLGWINTRIILSLTFFIFLTPLGVLSRLFSKDNLQIKNNNTTTFTKRNHKYSKDDLKNIW